MAKQTINIGTNPDDGTGDLLRDAFSKINDNFTEVYTELGGDTPSGIKFTGTTISTDATNQDLTIDPNGTGKLIVTGNQEISNDLHVKGDLQVDLTSTLTGATSLGSTLSVTGATTLSSTLAVTSTSSFTGAATFNGTLIANGNTDIGDTTADTLTVTARIDSSLLPINGSTYNIGSSSLRWATGYFADLDVSGNITLGGNLVGGDAGSDTITINGVISSNMIPSAASTYNIGSSGSPWSNVYSDTFTGALTGTVTGDVTGNITSTGTSTFTSIDVNGGAIDGTPIGATTPSSGVFTSVYVDNLQIDGNTIYASSGDIILNAVGNIDFGNNRLTGVGTPTANTDAVNKQYVDAITTAGFTLVDDGSVSTIIGGSETLAIIGSGSVTTSLSGDTLTINSADTLASVTGRGATTTAIVTVGSLRTDGIQINDNNVETTRSNDNLNLRTSGSGSIILDADVTITGTLTGVSLGIFNVVEDTTPQLGGALDLNSNNISGTGNINITGDITSSNVITADRVSTDGISVFDNVVRTTRSNDDLVLNPAGTGYVDVSATKVINMADPTNPQDAATKAYVDSQAHGPSWQSVIVADGSTVTSAVSGNGYFIDTTSFAHTIQLPGSPSFGDEITIIDYAGTADTNNITVDRNGNAIQGLASNLTVSTERAGLTLVYSGASQGWLKKYN